MDNVCCWHHSYCSQSTSDGDLSDDDDDDDDNDDNDDDNDNDILSFYFGMKGPVEWELEEESSLWKGFMKVNLFIYPVGVMLIWISPAWRYKNIDVVVVVVVVVDIVLSL